MIADFNGLLACCANRCRPPPLLFAFPSEGGGVYSDDIFTCQLSILCCLTLEKSARRSVIAPGSRGGCGGSVSVCQFQMHGEIRGNGHLSYGCM